MSKVITLAAAGLLGQVIGVSQLNRADMPDERPTGEPMPPWLVALQALTAAEANGVGGIPTLDTINLAWRMLQDPAAEHPLPMRVHPRRSFVEPVSDGDRPEHYENLIANDPRIHAYDLRTRSLDGRALVWRELAYERPLVGVRETHLRVHYALVDDRRRNAECKWCREAMR